MAKRAIEEDGSSYSNLNALIEELRGRRHWKQASSRKISDF
jgi:hypothetical protein